MTKSDIREPTHKGSQKARLAPTSGRMRSGIDPLTMLLFAFVALRILAGCSPQVAQPTLPFELIMGVVREIKRRKGLQFERGEKEDDERELKRAVHRHIGYFAFRRAEARGVTAANQNATIDRVEEDVDEMRAFVNQKLDGPIGLRQAAPDGPSSAGPTAAFTCDPNKHLDLENVAVYSTDEDGPKRSVKKYKQRRVQLGQAILWRAAAIHKELWNDSAAPGNRLNKDALEELLDRRLRVVERMHAQVNSPGLPAARTGGPTDWQDDARVRMFEYPIFDTEDFNNLIVHGDPLWRVEDNTPPDEDRITFSWNLPGRTITTRISSELNPSPAISPVWNVGPDPYFRIFVPGASTLSSAMTNMMQPTLDVWDRSWLFCDHVCVALNIDGLLFALMRRAARQGQPPTGKFDAIPAAGTSFVKLRPVVGGVPNGDLARPSTWVTFESDDLTTKGAGGEWFQNLYAPTRDLQVGDHVVYWNHLLYVAFYNGPFRLENAIVDGVDSTEDGKIYPSRVKLAGHGLPSNSIAGYGSEMATEINDGIRAAQERAVKEAALGNRKFLTSQGFLVFRWVPYPGIDPGEAGPWFVWLTRDFGNASAHNPYPIFWPDVPTMLRAINHSLTDDPEPSSDHNPLRNQPDFPNFPVGGRSFDLNREGVLFPLYLPVGESGSMDWMEYFNRRREDDDLQVILARLSVSSTAPNPNAAIGLSGDIPAFYMVGPEPLPIQVLRPTPRLSY